MVTIFNEQNKNLLLDTDNNQIKEEWRDISGYEGYYQVSNFGRVKRLETIVTCKSRWGGIRSFKVDAQILGVHLCGSGYPFVSLSVNGKVKRVMVHRIVAKTFLKNTYNKPCVNHIDGDKLNNNVGNLEYVTYRENSIHSHYVLGNKKTGQKKVINIDTGQSFQSIRDAALHLNLKYSTLQAMLSGRNKNYTNLRYAI